MPSPSTNGGDGRNKRGQFTKGNSYGRGNPFARRVASLRSALYDAVTEDDIRDIGRRLIQQSRAGDLAAAKLLLSYVLGKPAHAVDPDQLDAEEWRLAKEMPSETDLLLREFENCNCGLNL